MSSNDENEEDDQLENPENENIPNDDNKDDDSQEEEVLDILSDDEDLNIVIEIDESDLDIISDEDDKKVESPENEDIVLSKHKVQGKHSLKYDSIFKGKKEEPLDENELDLSSIFHKESIEVDKSSNYYSESIDNENYVRNKQVKEKVYNVLSGHTSINFLNNRRKPSRNDFNDYYTLLKSNLRDESFTNIEIFNELAVYFSDNLFNMFKLLEKQWRNAIISELQDHIGRNQNAKEIKNRNIYPETELEFNWIDEHGEIKTITGVVIEVDYEESMFMINSYEKIYEVDISMITKILNNTKFKYNLNKLNNIDFL